MKISAHRVHALKGHQAAVYAVSKGTLPDTIITAGSDKNIVEWDLHGIKPPRVIAHSASVVYSLLPLQKEPIMLIGNNQGGIHVVDLSKKAEVRYLLAHTIGVFDLIEIPSKNEFIASGADGNITVWSTEDFHCKHELKISEMKVRKMALSPDESKLALACSDQKIRILNTENFEVIKTIDDHQDAVNAVVFSPDSLYLISGTKDAHLQVRSATDYELLYNIPAHNYAIYSIAFSASGTLMATASRDKTIKIWNAGSFEVLHRFDATKNEGHKNSVNAIYWCPSTDLLASVSDDQSVMLWEVKSA